MRHGKDEMSAADEEEFPTMVKAVVDIVIEDGDSDEGRDKEGGKGPGEAEEGPGGLREEKRRFSEPVRESSNPMLLASTADGGQQLSRRGSMTFYTLGKTYTWVSRARVAAWFRAAFQLPGTAEEEEAASLASTPAVSPLPRRDSEDNAGVVNNRKFLSTKAMSSGCLQAATAKRLYVMKSDGGSQSRGMTLEPTYHSVSPRRGLSRRSTPDKPLLTMAEDEKEEGDAAEAADEASRRSSSQFSQESVQHMMRRASSGLVWMEDDDFCSRLHGKLIDDGVAAISRSRSSQGLQGC